VIQVTRPLQHKLIGLLPDGVALKTPPTKVVLMIAKTNAQ